MTTYETPMTCPHCKRYEQAILEGRELLSFVGIYPQSVAGPNGYEKRDDYKNGWNAALMEVGVRFDAIMERTKLATWDDEAALLVRSGLVDSVDGKLLLKLGDTFDYACADREEIEPGEVQEASRLFMCYGAMGLAYWAAENRGYDPAIPSHKQQVEFIRATEVERNKRKAVPV